VSVCTSRAVSIDHHRPFSPSVTSVTSNDSHPTDHSSNTSTFTAVFVGVVAVSSAPTGVTVTVTVCVIV
jgi:hypothetical protein